MAGVALPHVHAAESGAIQVALVGCGGRGTGAAIDALSVTSAPIKIVALADVFENRLANSATNLAKRSPEKATVPPERQFQGFDAYKKAIDCLKPGDVVILATPPAFRWPQFAYAIEKGVNVFMEKPITVDGPSTRKLLALAEQSVKKDLKVGVGLMCRHCKSREALLERINGGEIGELVSLRAYRMGGGAGFTGPRGEAVSELLHQVQRFHSFMWASGGVFMDFLIHNIDECCWMKGAWPIQAQGTGARCHRGNNIDQNFDNYSIEYVFPDGARLQVYARFMGGCHNEFASYAHGSKGSAVISTAAHTPAKCRIYKGQKIDPAALSWAFPQPEPNPYQLEWVDLIDAIVKNKLYNEARRGAEASLVTAMGRMAVHTGRIVTWDEMLGNEHEFAPTVDKLTPDSPAPLRADTDGKYPQPTPGIKRNREF